MKSELAALRGCSCEKQSLLSQELLSATLGFVRSLCSSLFICAVPPLHILLSWVSPFHLFISTALLQHLILLLDVIKIHVSPEKKIHQKDQFNVCGFNGRDRTFHELKRNCMASLKLMLQQSFLKSIPKSH